MEIGISLFPVCHFTESFISSAFSFFSIKCIYKLERNLSGEEKKIGFYNGNYGATCFVVFPTFYGFPGQLGLTGLS